MPDVTLTFDLNVQHSFSPMLDELAEHKVTIPVPGQKDDPNDRT